MNRRKALTVAGTVAATVAGGSLAVAANFGLLGFARGDSASLGALEADYPLQNAAASPVTTETTAPASDLPPEVIVKYDDILVPSGPGPATPASSSAPQSVAPTAASEPEDVAEPEDSPDETTSTTVAPSTTTTTAPTPSGTFEDDHVSGDGSFAGFEDD